MRAFILAACCFLQACSTPPEADSQVRLSEVRGAVEGGRGVLIQGAVTGVACILSFIGEIPSGVEFDLQQGECAAWTKGSEGMVKEGEAVEAVTDEAVDEWGWIP